MALCPLISHLPLNELSCSCERPELAAQIYKRHGLCVLTGAFDENSCNELLQTYQLIDAAVKELDPMGDGNRGPGRYCVHEVTWNLWHQIHT